METNKSTDGTLTVFDILEALTGELPCYASPNWKVSGKRPAKENLPAITSNDQPMGSQDEQTFATGSQ